jgi:hypothetical protein
MRLLSTVAFLVSVIVVSAYGATLVAPSYTLPAQPPGTGDLEFWIDHKTNKNFVFEDDFVSPTIAMLEDMTGNGNGFNQINKMLQPSLGPMGGPFFGPGTFLPCVGGDLLAGAQRVTLGFAFTLSSSYTGGAPRVLFDISNGGTSQHQLTISATGGTGTTARMMQVTLQPNGGSQLTTTTSGVWQLSANVKHTFVVEVNLAENPATVNMYVDGLVYGPTKTFAAPQNAFASEETTAISLGNAFTTPGPDRPLVGEIAGGLGYLNISAIERNAMLSYLAGL